MIKLGKVSVETQGSKSRLPQEVAGVPWTQL